MRQIKAARALGIEIADETHLPGVVAFGDQPNDLPMLNLADHPFAVGNAHRDVKRAVDERGGYHLRDSMFS